MPSHARSRFVPALVLFLGSLAARGQVITTVAGGGSSISNGVLATTALTSASQGLVVDPSGNLYYWDAGTFVVRKVDTNGIVNTVAGNGKAELAIVGSIGDGGPAINAGFEGQGLFAGMALDAAGNLYICDPGNKRIRKVDGSGIINTVVTPGVNLNQPAGIAFDSAGNLYIADASIGRVYKIPPTGNGTTVAGGGTGGDGVQATSSSILSPLGIAFDAQGNLYIAENRGRVRKVNTSGVISTVAGGNSQGFAGDGGLAVNALFAGIEGLAVDKAGNLYIADNGNYRVRKVDTNGIITTVAGSGQFGFGGDNGLATNATLTPGGLAFDASGNLYITAGNVRKVALGASPAGLWASVPAIYFEGTVAHPTPAPQIEVIGTQGAPIAFKVSTTTLAGPLGWLNTSGPNGSTPQIIQVNVASPGPTAAGTYKGTITFTPTTPGYAALNVPVTVVINPTPPAVAPVITDVENGASFLPGYAANSVWTIKGTNLASTTDTWDNSIVGGQLPTSLDGVTVLFGSYPAYISYLSPTQINVLTPDSGLGAPLPTVNNNGAISNFFPIQGSSLPYSPAFFTWPGSQAVATHQDYSYAVKPGTFAGLTTIAAKPGDVIILWGTGFGGTTPATQDGAVVPSDKTYSTSSPVTVTVGGVNATVYGAALAAGYAGLYQVAIQVPPTLAKGDYAVIASVGLGLPVPSPSGVILSVAP